MRPKAYLNQEYKANTAAVYLRLWKKFEEYINQLNINLEAVDYPLILEYVHDLQAEELSPIYINKNLVAIEKVFEGLGLSIDNPTRSFRVKRGGDLALSEPIKVEELAGVLERLPSNTAREVRDKVVLSLVHNQALSSSDLGALEVDCIDLDKAILFVPSTGKSNSRELLLQARQIRLLDQYIKEARPQLYKYETAQLILTGGSGRKIRSLLQRLVKRLQKELPVLKNLEHWRSSIIIDWLGHQPLLEVQSKLGHKFASSTERYQLQAVESLQEALKKYHPLLAD